MENEVDALVEHSGKFSSITRRGRVLARDGGHGWKEHDEAVLEHRSKLKSDLVGENDEYVSSWLSWQIFDDNSPGMGPGADWRPQIDRA